VGRLGQLDVAPRASGALPAGGPLALGGLLGALTWLSNVRTSLRNGVDESLGTQGSYCTPGGGAGYLVSLDQLALGRDTTVRRILARQNPSLEDGRYLPVGRYRGKRVNPVSWHMINFRCRKSLSYISKRIDTSQQAGSIPEIAGWPARFFALGHP
jgi:hypothetical protein